MVSRVKQADCTDTQSFDVSLVNDKISGASLNTISAPATKTVTVSSFRQSFMLSPAQVRESIVLRNTKKFKGAHPV